MIIDEISMVSRHSLEHITQRLNEIFGTPNEIFAGLLVMLVGDLMQFTPR